MDHAHDGVAAPAQHERPARADRRARGVQSHRPGLRRRSRVKHVPSTLLAEARRRRYPVFSIPLRTPFRDVISTINRALLSTDLRTLQRLSSMQLYLMDALGEDDPQNAVVERLSAFLDATVVLFASNGTVAASTGEAPSADIWREVMARPATVVELDLGHWHAIATPVSTGPGPAGWLAVTSRPAPVRSARATGRPRDGSGAGGTEPHRRSGARPAACDQSRPARRDARAASAARAAGARGARRVARHRLRDPGPGSADRSTERRRGRAGRRVRSLTEPWPSGVSRSWPPAGRARSRRSCRHRTPTSGRIWHGWPTGCPTLSSAR